MKISVNVPSYKRPNDIKTLQYLPYVEVLEPASLREEIMTVLEKNRYR